MAWSPTTRTVVKTLAWVPVAIFFIDHGFSFATVNGRSMQPTFNPDSSMLRKDIVLLNRWAVVGHKFQHGDIVTLRSPYNPDRIITKRIMALEGDTIRTLKPYPETIVRVPKGHCWVEGDEAFHSKDSNMFGPVALGLIDAKITWILWPLDRFGPPQRITKPERVIMSPQNRALFLENFEDA